MFTLSPDIKAARHHAFTVFSHLLKHHTSVPLHMDTEDSLVLHAPPTADIDAEFNQEEEPVAARPPSALAMLLLRLSLEERQGDSSLRSSAIIDNASQPNNRLAARG